MVASSHRVDILGVEVSAIDMQMALSTIHDWIEEGRRHYVCVTGVHGVMESQRDPALRAIHNQSGLTTPDGMPMVWAGRLAGAKWMQRVYGPDLLLEVCAQSVDKGWSHYFYGGAPGTPERLAKRLEDRFPGLKVAGVWSPPYRPLTDEEAIEVVANINMSDPTFVWVGLSTPKQEWWMAEYAPRISAPVVVGIGAAFDIHAGLKTQAPAWMRRMGLEWLYRLAQEPGRLASRYLSNNPRFVVRVMRRRPRLLPREST